MARRPWGGAGPTCAYTRTIFTFRSQNVAAGSSTGRGVLDSDIGPLQFFVFATIHTQVCLRITQYTHLMY